jgi:hypothetical protein
MFNVRFLAGGGATAPTITVPDGIAFRLAAGTQLMIQTHWINSTGHAVEVQAAANLRVDAPSEARSVADLFNVVTTQFEVPAGKKQDAVASCVMKEELSAWLLGGHAHEYTSRITVDQKRGGEDAQRIYDTSWQPEYTTNAPLQTYTKEAPLLLKAGDTIKVACSIDNTDGKDPIGFPKEMCLTFGFYFPSHGEFDCVDGSWSN